MKAKAIVSKISLMVALGFMAYFTSVIYDAIANAKYHARNVNCKSNLKYIGQQINIYRKTHKKQLPANLIAIAKSDKFSFICTIVGSEIKTDGKLTYYTYAYRYVKSPSANDIICWDRKPHVPHHAIFTNKNFPRRNVLLANGSVKTIPEQEFQAKRLTGKVGELNAYTFNWAEAN